MLRDYDLDGDKDIFTAGIFGMRVFENAGSLTWNIIEDPLRTLGFSGMIGLQMNASDIPAIADFDGDLDLDVLVFDFANGSTIRPNSREVYIY